MGAERIISLRLKLKGDQEVIDTLEVVNNSLEESGRILKDINDKSRALDNLSRKLKTMSEELEQVSRRLAAAQAGTGSGNSTQLETQQRRLRSEIDQTKASVADLRKQLAGVEQGSDAYNQIVQRIARAKGEQKLLNDQVRQAQVAFERTQVAAGSYRDLELRLQQLRNQFRLLGEEERNGALGTNLLRQIGVLDTQLKDLDKNMGVYTRNVGNYASAFDGFVGITQRLAPVVGLSVGLNEFIDANARASDEVANVAKTANASINDIRQLQEVLKFRNTRTKLVDQLGIAEIGGQLGVAKEQLLGFTDAVDQVNVAVGDEFNNDVKEVTRVLGGLRNVFSNIRTDDIPKDILNIANALNVLSADGNATAPAIADFANRIGGVAVPLGASAESIFGLSTVLNELNITAERGSSGVVRVLTEIAKAPEAFAQVAGVGAKEFRALVEKDIVGALALVTKRTQESTDSNIEFVKILQDLEITGVGELEVFQKLGASYDLYQKRVQQAGKALQETQSITDEFNKKNATFGASLDKLRNSFVNLTVSTDLQDFLAGGIDALAGFITALAGLPKLIQENKTEFIALTLAILAFNRAAIIATLATIRQSAAYTLLTDATRRQALAQGILNTVTKAFPILAVVAIIYAAAKAIQAFTTSTDAATRAADKFKEAQKDINKEAGKEVAILNKNIEVLKSAAASTTQRANAIKALKDAYPEYLEGMDLEKLSVAELTTLQNRLTQEIIRGIAERKKAAAQDEELAKVVEATLARQQLRQRGTVSVEDVAAIGEDPLGLNQALGRTTFISDEAKQEAFKRADAFYTQLIEDGTKAANELENLFNDAFSLRNVGTEEIAASAASEVLAERAEQQRREQVNIRKLTIDELKALDTDAAKAELERREKADKRLKDLAEKRARDEKTAAENIYRLQQDLIKRTFEGRIQLARNETATAISALVGTPQQVETQKALLEEKLRQTIALIEKERADAQSKALADIRAFKQAAEQARADNAGRSAGNQLDAIRQLNQIDETKAQGFFTLEQQALQDQLSKGLITQEEYNEKSEALELQRQWAIFEIRNQSAVAEKTLIVQEQQARLAALAAGFQKELQQIEEQEAQRKAALEAQLESGAIDQPTFDAAVEDNTEATNQAKLDAERAYREEQAVIVQDAAQQILDTEVELAEQSLAIQQDTDQAKLDSAKRTAEQMAALQSAQLDGVSEYITGVSRLLSQDVENRRKYGAILKVLALAEIAINLRKELSAIAVAASQASLATGPFGIFTAGTIYAAQAAQAIIRASFNAASVLLQKFKYGGVIPTEQSVARVEGGHIPEGSGEITGRPHSAGGVKAIYNNRLVEFEGGEYHLRNGKETYIINRKSTQRFKETLLRISDAPNRFSRARKQIASQINSHGGAGKKFATGGIAPGAPTDVNPLQAPQVGPAGKVVLNAASREDLDAVLQVAGAAIELATAANNRIDNIQVINDPLEALKKGTEQAEIKATRNL